MRLISYIADSIEVMLVVDLIGQGIYRLYLPH